MNFLSRYNKLSSQIRDLAEKLSTLETTDPFRNECTGQLLEKLYSMGVISTKRLKHCKEVSVSSFCRRRLPVFITKSGMLNGPLEVAGKFEFHIFCSYVNFGCFFLSS